jgi:ElaB/YqjD/DUF883 family membrane-anchored ribosome-binding protein
MTDPATQQRDALRARIEAAERRNAERSLADQAREAATAAADYTRANPLTVIGGAVALGLVIGLLTRPGRRVAGQALHSAGEAISDAASTASSGVKRVTVRSGSRLGEVIGEAVMGYVMTAIEELIDAARTGQERAGELGEAAGKEAKKLSGTASEAAGAAADSTRELVRRTADVAAGVVREIRAKTKA